MKPSGKSKESVDEEWEDEDMSAEEVVDGVTALKVTDPAEQGAEDTTQQDENEEMH